MKIFGLMLFTLAIMGCRPAPSSHLKQFFDQSSRRDPIPGESSGLAKLENGCTAFFIENGGPSNILVTARHCTDEQPEQWCEKTGGFTTWDGRSRHCSAIAFEASDSDIVLFLDDSAKYDGQEPLFQLDPLYPSPGQPLQMFGYPSDRLRKGQLTVSENCEVRSEETANPHGEPRRDPAQMHNCSTYGGNSGGPLVRAKTRSVVGLPITYLYNYYEQLSGNDQDSLAYYAAIPGFLARFSDQLGPLQLTMAADSTGENRPILWPPQSAVEQSFSKDCELSLAHGDARTPQFQALLQQLQAPTCAELSQKVSRVSEISLARRGLTSLDVLDDPIFHGGQLKALYLSGNPLSDPAPIMAIRSLVLLDLSGTSIKSLGSVSANNLEILFANDLGIQSLKDFMGETVLPSIKRLYFKGNSISDAGLLKKMKTLRVLSLADLVNYDRDTLLASLVGQDQLTSLGLYGVIYDQKDCPLVAVDRCGY